MYSRVSAAILLSSAATVVVAQLPFADPGPAVKADADITFYLPGEPGPLSGPGACGIQNHITDPIVAISQKYWDKIAALAGTGGNGNANPLCNLQIEITTSKGTETATITDRCGDCEREDSVDVTPALAEKLIGPDYKTVGRVTSGVSWKFKGVAGGASGSASGAPVAESSSVVPLSSAVDPPVAESSAVDPPVVPSEVASDSAVPSATGVRLPGSQSSGAAAHPSMSALPSGRPRVSASGSMSSSASFDDGLYHSSKYANGPAFTPVPDATGAAPEAASASSVPAEGADQMAPRAWKLHKRRGVNAKRRLQVTH